jgi:hypothetical protein
LLTFETAPFFCVYPVYRIPPDDGLQIFPKHVEVDWRNKLRINSAWSWFSLYGYSDWRNIEREHYVYCRPRLYFSFRGRKVICLLGCDPACIIQVRQITALKLIVTVNQPSEVYS